MYSNSFFLLLKGPKTLSPTTHQQQMERWAWT